MKGDKLEDKAAAATKSSPEQPRRETMQGDGPPPAADQRRPCSIQRSWDLRATFGSVQEIIGGAHPRQDSAFEEKWCCKNGFGASQATGESVLNEILEEKVPKSLHASK